MNSWNVACKKCCIISNFRNKEKLQAFESQHGSVTKGYSCDVTNRQQMEQTVSEIEADLGAIGMPIL